LNFLTLAVTPRIVVQGNGGPLSEGAVSEWEDSYLYLPWPMFLGYICAVI